MFDIKGKIGVCIDKSSFCHRFLQKLSSLGLKSDALCLFLDEKRTVQYHDQIITTRPLNLANMEDCTLIVNICVSEFIDKFSADLLSKGIKIIDLSTAFIKELDISTGLSDMPSNLVLCSDGFSIGLHKLISFVDKMVNFSSISIARYSGYKDDESSKSLLDETKRTFFEPRIDGSVFEHQIAFNAWISKNNSEIEYIKKTIPKAITVSYNSVNIPILNLDGAALYMHCTDNIKQSIVNEVTISVSNANAIDGFVLSQKGSMLEAAHETQIYISDISLSGSVFSMFVYMDPAEQQIQEVIRVIRLMLPEFDVMTKDFVLTS